jgi:hypothetical protein
MENQNQTVIEPFFYIETCVNCHTHQWCTRHKSETYANYAQKVSARIQEVIPGVKVLTNCFFEQYIDQNAHVMIQGGNARQIVGHQNLYDIGVRALNTGQEVNDYLWGQY